ncbi:tetratricopeptide repeat protein [Caulifigura coniformis]|uniref:Tetratricopeptide repeat protein n=1 Tax=Caulifigura coniformis TaxID=2527983 RepID=A0A517S868_9PLAN|nr:tetratricopeptide repeat protein [Caulifigura coniformis]QDT52328.1 tetratricopeptide repeat protein [Caulifigura coniformis]
MNLGRVALRAFLLTAFLLPAAPLRADVADDLKAARNELSHGRYDAAVAVAAWTRLADAARDDERAEAVIGLSRSLLETGNFDEAEKRLAAAVDQLPDSAPLRAHLAALHLARGRYVDALKQADAALVKNGEQLLARLVRARIKIEQGKLEPAAEDFRWFVQYYNRRQPKDAESLLLIAEGSAGYARARGVGQVFSFIVNDLTPDAVKADPNAWQSYFLSGSLLLEKHNNGQARQEFRRGLDINPHSADLLVGMARAELDERNPEKARTLAEQALATNARHIDALLLLANVELGAEAPAAALPWITRALDVNPQLQEGLALKAGCDLLLNGIPDDGLSLAVLSSPATAPAEIAGREYVQILKSLVERNPAPGQFLTELGTVLEQARRYDPATSCYARAIDVAPQLSAPRTALGLLQMRTGDLASARKILDDAFRADRFHVRVSNMRKVLDVLERYETQSTDHFILRYDATDKVFASYLSEELESLYEPLTKEFGFEPPERTAFEIFSAAKGESGHSWFSARMTGMPWIQTIGASTGMIVALSSPTTREPYNWARVAKHEFCHVLTLQQTNFGIPHWYTEALAVRTEGNVFPETWRRLLIDRREAGTLFTLETVNNGFQRPKNGDDWQHAYCMSRLYARYMEETFGSDSLFRLVDAYRKGLKTPAAIREVFGVSLADFEKGFTPFLDRVIEELNDGKVPRSPALASAQATLTAAPDNLDHQAAVAWALLNDAPPSRGAEAGKMADKILEASPKHPLALAILARLDMRDRKERSARRRLETAFDPEDPHPAVVSILGRLAFDDKDYKTSAAVFGAGLAKYPRELSFTYLLAISLFRLDQTERLPELFQKVAERDFDDLTSRTWLLHHAIEEETWEEAIRWGREAMQIDVRDAATHRGLGLAYLKSGNQERARRHLKTALELKPDDQDARKLLDSAK